MIGRSFPETEGQRLAWSGVVSASMELGDEEDADEAALGLPLLEIYSPVREVWSGEVIAVAEFYAVEDLLVRDLANARRQSWLIVAGVFALCGASLFGIVSAGGRTIASQQTALRDEAEHVRAIAEQNAALRQRAVSASARATAETERRLRQASADLHDGPAQYLGLAALRLDRAVPDSDEGRVRGRGDARGGDDGADRDTGDLARAVAARPRARDAGRRGGAGGRPACPAGRPTRSKSAGRVRPTPRLDLSTRTCAFRFLQEALSNAQSSRRRRAGAHRGRRGARDAANHRPRRRPGLRPDGARAQARRRARPGRPARPRREPRRPYRDRQRARARDRPEPAPARAFEETPHEHPHRDRGRPSDLSRGPRAQHRRKRRVRRGRRGWNRRRGRRAGRRDPAGPRPAGRVDAGQRHRRRGPDRDRPSGRPHRDAHRLRSRPRRDGGDEGRRHRLRAEGRLGDRAARGSARGRGRPGARVAGAGGAGAGGDAGPRRRRATAPGSTTSPSARRTSCAASRAA